MLNLRIVGAILAFVAAVIFYRLYRTHGGKLPLIGGTLFTTLLLAVSIYPDLMNVLIHQLTRTKGQFYRIIVLLTLTVIMLSIMLVRLQFTSNYHSRKLKELAVGEAVRSFQFEERADDPPEIQIVIPAYNEANNLARLLPEIPDEYRSRSIGVLVVSDGSTDNTVDVVREHGAECVTNSTNLGGGIALQIGFEIAQMRNPDVVVTMDADGQHRPEDLPALLEPVLDGNSDFVLGSRRLGEGPRTSFLRSAGIVFFNLLISVLLMRRITDCSSGYRAFRSELLDSLHLSEPRFHTTEFLIQALAHDWDFKEVPVTIRERTTGSSKKPPDLLYGFGFSRVLLKTWLHE